MEEVKEVFDPKTGFTFKYTLDNFGWSITLGKWFFENKQPKRRELVERAALLAPEVPVELKAEVDLENRKLQSITKGTPWPKIECDE